MIALTFFLLLVPWTARAVLQEKSVDALLLQLGSPEIEERNAADRELRARGAAAMPAIRKFIESRSNPEAEARAGAILKDFLVAESRALADKGRLDEALRILAESEKSKDLQATVDQHLAAVRKEMQSWFPRADRTVNALPNVQAQVQRVWGVHGLWGMKVLLEELAEPTLPQAPVAEYLIEIGAPALPHVVVALRSPRHLSQSGACTVLQHWLNHKAGPKYSREWLEAATLQAGNRGIDAWVRNVAQEMIPALIENRRFLLLRALGSERPEERDAAEKDLRAEGPEALPYLKRFPRENLPPEARERLDRVLKHLDAEATPKK